MYALCACLLLGSAAGDAGALSPAYGAEPWLWWGTAAAAPTAVVSSAHGSARFTVLTPRTIRLEFSPDGAWEDGKTLVIWNRLLPVPPFNMSVAGDVTTIDTGALLLTHTDDGTPLSARNLRVERRAPAFFSNSSMWTPDAMPAVDAGQLFGTFHTLDNNLDGNPGLNCSLLDPNREAPDATADFYPCDFGLISKSGWSVVDDSRSPVWDEGAGWLATQDKVTCDAANATPCFPGGFDTPDAALCHAAGCCPAQAPVPLNLWLSASRADFFTDSLNCTGGCDDLYAFVRPQGFALSGPSDGLVPLNLYWNAAPVAGAGGDNVASSFPPAPPGYAFARVEGYVFDPALPQPPGTVPLRVYYSAARLDHYTTAGPADEANATAWGYTLVGLAGYALADAPSPTPALACSAPVGHQDWYLLGHGLDYTGAVADYVALGGPVPIPRRHWMGMSWSKWNESDTDAGVVQDVEALVAAGFPLDTYIFDMQWHRTPDWGGYSWDPARYANATALLGWLADQGLATGANLHDADGVRAAANPERWPAFAAAVGADPASAGVAFDIANHTYADALRDAVLAPLQSQGLDMLWTDFQQGFPGVAAVRGLVPTALLNHYRFHNASRVAGIRGTQHSRYAGRGDHRHTSAFGGDVNQSWESLAFMVLFTATAANAPVCWWGHEMMRAGGGLGDNAELFTRVLQFGAWSPTFTTWGNSGSNNNLWQMPEPHLSAVRGALLDRARLLPYRYSAAAAAAATGACPVRAMYHGWPAEAEAYVAPAQYLLGEDVIVAPVAAPVAGPVANGTAGVSVWLPPGGEWVQWEDPSASHPGGGWVALQAGIRTTPALVRAGAVLPTLPANLSALPGASARQYSALDWLVWPGAAPGAAGSGSAYEDDGLSTDYLGGASAVTTLTYAPAPPAAGDAAAGACIDYTIVTTGSGYAGMLAARAYTVTLLRAPAPAAVSVDGVPLPQSGVDGRAGTYFRTAAGDTAAYLPPQPDARAPQTLRVCAP